MRRLMGSKGGSVKSVKVICIEAFNEHAYFYE